MEWEQKEHLWLERPLLSRAKEANPLWPSDLTQRSRGVRLGSGGEDLEDRAER